MKRGGAGLLRHVPLNEADGISSPAQYTHTAQEQQQQQPHATAAASAPPASATPRNNNPLHWSSSPSISLLHELRRSINAGTLIAPPPPPPPPLSPVAAAIVGSIVDPATIAAGGGGSPRDTASTPAATPSQATPAVTPILTPLTNALFPPPTVVSAAASPEMGAFHPQHRHLQLQQHQTRPPTTTNVCDRCGDVTAAHQVSPQRSSRLSLEFSGGHQKIQENPGAERNGPEQAELYRNRMLKRGGTGRNGENYIETVC